MSILFLSFSAFLVNKLSKKILNKIGRGNTENEINNSKVFTPKSAIIEQSEDLSSIASNGRIKKNKGLTIKN